MIIIAWIVLGTVLAWFLYVVTVVPVDDAEPDIRDWEDEDAVWQAMSF